MAIEHHDSGSLRQGNITVVLTLLNFYIIIMFNTHVISMLYM